MRRRVIIESPYADSPNGVEYARAALRDSLRRGEAPLASHLLYTQVLDDADSQDRSIGITAGLAWLAHAEATVAYVDLGISEGMRFGIEKAYESNVPVEIRRLEGWLLKRG